MLRQTNKTLLQGFLIGLSDIIPGVSGGTIAFILGIYIRLINSVKNITPKNILNVIRHPKNFKKYDFHFLGLILIGILSAVLIFSRLILFALENYLSYTLIFFVGLILASSKVIFNEIENHKLNTQIYSIFGFIIGISILFLTPTSIENPSYSYIFFAGVISISAMFLPGISGAFILLILGVYEFVLESIRNITSNFSYLLFFIIGLATGAVLISRIISFLYKKDKCKTLYTLLGLVVGTLLIPINRIYEEQALNQSNILVLGLFLLAGFLTVSALEKIRTKNT